MSLSSHRLIAANEKKRQAAHGSALLGDVLTHLKRFCALPGPPYYDAVVLWIALAHMAEHFHTLPRLAALSAEPGSGKSRLLEIVRDLVPEPMFVFGASVAALFRTMSERSVTLLFDECDTIFSRRGKDDQNEDLRALLNVGYRNGATIPRCVGPQHSVEHFNVFAPAALAGLGDLPETLMSRSIVIRMRRRAPHEHIEPYRARLHEHQGNELSERLAEWAAAVGPDAGEAWPELPDGIVDRMAEIWEPLIAIGDAAGCDWPERARQAANYFAAIATERSPSLGIKLLEDLKAVFDGRGQMFTDDILRDLNLMEESPWSNLKGEPLDARGLAYRLKQYGAQSRQIRIGTDTRKGYSAADLWDAWQRYCSVSPPAESETSETAETIRLEQADTQANVSHVSHVSDSGPPERGMPERHLLFTMCKDACTGTDVDPSDLCQDIIESNDPVMASPKAIARMVTSRQEGGS